MYCISISNPHLCSKRLTCSVGGEYLMGAIIKFIPTQSQNFSPLLRFHQLFPNIGCDYSTRRGYLYLTPVECCEKIKLRRSTILSLVCTGFRLPVHRQRSNSNFVDAHDERHLPHPERISKTKVNFDTHQPSNQPIRVI